MNKYVKKPIVIEAITFDELKEHGRKWHENCEDNKAHMGFFYNGHEIFYVNEECYLIPTLEGNHNMTPKDMLITGVNGEIYPCKIDIFDKTYDKV